MAVKVLAFAGSLRQGSFNKKLVREAMEGAQAAGAEVTYLDLRDYPLPVFDEDLEKAEGLHPNARRLKDAFLAHQGLLIASPEYNSMISAALKNAVDWISRPCIQPDGKPEPPLACLKEKVAGLVAASPGALGGLRGLVSLRMLLGNLGVLVVPEQFALVKAGEAFDENGRLKDPKHRDAAHKVAARVASIAAKLHS